MAPEGKALVNDKGHVICDQANCGRKFYPQRWQLGAKPTRDRLVIHAHNRALNANWEVVFGDPGVDFCPFHARVRKEARL